MKRILICTVGGSDAPVVHAIQQTTPTHVYFICSGGERGSAKTITEAVTTSPGQRCPACKAEAVPAQAAGPIARKAGLLPASYSVFTVSDPDDIDQVSEACRQVDEDIRSSEEAREVLANYTGGTKTMSVGLFLYAYVMARDWTLQLNTSSASRPDLVRVAAGDISVAQQAQSLHLQQSMQRAQELIAAHEYDSAAEVLESFLQGARPAMRSLVSSVHLEALMRVAWDRFDHAAARELATQDEMLAGKHSGHLKKLIRVKALLRGTETWSLQDVPGTLLVGDLIEIAEHCAARHRYDDAVARLYRATELLAQVRLRQHYGLRTGDIDCSSESLVASPEACRWLESHRGQQRTTGAPDPIQLGLVASYELLTCLGDPLGAYFERSRTRLLTLIKARSHSLLAHGIDPIDDEKWNEIGPLWLGWLRDAVRILEQPAGAL
ncbi:MAG: TIGR02710 family CRISPR-associated protein [Acidobacteria bacterium]|nr:TIGR02710 family CRISPR-associated protein [Acidobacteriota bacterium]